MPNTIGQRSVIYLANPYSHEDPEVRRGRARAAARYAGQLMNDGQVVYSPITHCHPIAELIDLPKGWDFWKRFDTEMIRRCDEMIVLCLEGWRESRGVQAEIRIAEEMGLPISYVVVDSIYEAILMDSAPCTHPRKELEGCADPTFVFSCPDCGEHPIYETDTSQSDLPT